MPQIKQSNPIQEEEEDDDDERIGDEALSVLRQTQTPFRFRASGGLFIIFIYYTTIT